MADISDEQEVESRNESSRDVSENPLSNSSSLAIHGQSVDTIVTVASTEQGSMFVGRPSTFEYHSVFGGGGALTSTITKICERSYLQHPFGNLSFWEITGLIFVYLLWEWLRQLFVTRIGPPFGRFLSYLAKLCDALAKSVNHDRGEWGVVIREPLQAQYRATLVGLPAEIMDIIVAFCEPVPHNGMRMFGVDYLIDDRLHRDGTRRIVGGPRMLGLAQTNRQLRYFWMMHMLKDRVLVLRHEDVEKTVDLLAGMYPSARNGIRGLRIEWQRTKPVDYKSFRRLCGILNSMPRLSILHLTIPVNGNSAFGAILDPGLWNALVWHAEKIVWDTKKASEVLRGFGWSTNRRAGWVRDLLGVRGNRNPEEDGIQDFRLDTYPPAEGSNLKMWLENKMTLEWEYKVAEFEKINRQRSWIDWISI